MVMAGMPSAPPERWVRGVGSGGIGTSGHINQYGAGVLVGNFVEDVAGTELATQGIDKLGFGAVFAGSSTQRRSYNLQGKEGPELLAASERVDKDLKYQGLGGDLLMRHGDFWASQPTYLATLNQLTLKADRQLDEPCVSAHVWSGSNKHNAQVALSTQKLALTSTKRGQWQQEEEQGQYATTTRGGQLTSAQHAAAHPSKAGTLRLQTDGEASMVGRKPKGEFADETNKTYRRTGLRGIYYSGNLS